MHNVWAKWYGKKPVHPHQFFSRWRSTILVTKLVEIVYFSTCSTTTTPEKFESSDPTINFQDFNRMLWVVPATYGLQYTKSISRLIFRCTIYPESPPVFLSNWPNSGKHLQALIPRAPLEHKCSFLHILEPLRSKLSNNFMFICLDHESSGILKLFVREAAILVTSTLKPPNEGSRKDDCVCQLSEEDKPWGSLRSLDQMHCLYNNKCI